MFLKSQNNAISEEKEIKGIDFKKPNKLSLFPDYILFFLEIPWKPIEILGTLIRDVNKVGVFVLFCLCLKERERILMHKQVGVGWVEGERES